MGYRDELEALRARNAELEAQLEAARRELRQRGRPEVEDPRSVLLGGPTRLTRVVELEGEIDDEGLELLVAELRQYLGEVGRTEQLGKTLTWATSTGQSGRIVEVTCRRHRGTTRIQIRENLKQLAGGLFGGGLGGGGGGGMAFVVPMGLRFPSAIPFLIVSWLCLVYALVRGIYGRVADKRAASLDELVFRLDTELRSAAGRERVRVEAGHEAEAVREAEAELEVEQASRERRAR